VSAGWTAASVRGRGLLRRRLGRDGARDLAASSTLEAALERLALSAYGRDVRSSMGLEAAQHAVSATALWHLRVLAGWDPPLGAGPLRLLAGRFEIANITGHLASLGGGAPPATYDLGSLATAWPAVAAAGSVVEVRATLASSPWGDPGSEDPAAIRVALQLAWARRVYDGAPGAADWAVAAGALVVARLSALGATATLGPGPRRDARHLLGTRWDRASSPAEVGSMLAPGASVLAGLTAGIPLWEAEARWWGAVEASAETLAAQPRPDASAGVGVAALLLAGTPADAPIPRTK